MSDIINSIYTYQFRTATKVFIKGDKAQLTHNFTLSEFECNCNYQDCNITLVNVFLVDFLQKMRDHFNAPIILSSAYRCQKHNKFVKGSKKSQHLFGTAVDFSSKSSVDRKDIAKWIKQNLKNYGLGEYADGRLHFDVRDVKAVWS